MNATVRSERPRTIDSFFDSTVLFVIETVPWRFCSGFELPGVLIVTLRKSIVPDPVIADGLLVFPEIFMFAVNDPLNSVPWVSG